MVESSNTATVLTLKHWDTVTSFDSFQILMLCTGRDPYGSEIELKDSGVIFNYGVGRRIKELLHQAVTRGWGWCYQRLAAAAGLAEKERHDPVFTEIPRGTGAHYLGSSSTSFPLLISNDLEWRYLERLLEDCDHESFHDSWDRSVERSGINSTEACDREAVAAWLKSVRWSIGYDFSAPDTNFAGDNKTASFAEITVHAPQKFHSDRLTALIQASRKFWANADELDKTTHQTNTIVAEWLVSRGFSQSLAKHGAAIIRPSWADTGRPPEK